MIYRDAREDDAGQLVEMANRELMPEAISEATMRDMVQDRSVVVAEDEDGVVGYVSYSVLEGSVVIQHACVEPGHRSTEVPGELLRRPVEFAESEGMSTRVAVEEGSWLVERVEGDGFEHRGEASFAGRDLAIYER